MLPASSHSQHRTVGDSAALSRRQFCRQATAGLGLAAFAALIGESRVGKLSTLGHGSAPRGKRAAKRVIFITLVGGPSQIDLFDDKPELRRRAGQDFKTWLSHPDGPIPGLRAGVAPCPVAPSRFRFSQHGQSGASISELLPFHAKMADDLCIIRSMQTDFVDHLSAARLLHTGTASRGGSAIGACLSHELGALENESPAFAVLHAQSSNPLAAQHSLPPDFWGSGSLPENYAGFTVNPGPLAHETNATLNLYGDQVSTKGTFAHCALTACRLVERGARFVQVFHQGWDHHNHLPGNLLQQARDIDRGSYALVQDLKQRCLLEDTIVVWGGEFGRTFYSQGACRPGDYGRDHHSRCFTLWLAGGGIKPGTSHGETDEMSYDVVRDPVHVRDLHATLLHRIGLDPAPLYLGSPGFGQAFRGHHPARIIKAILT